MQFKRTAESLDRVQTEVEHQQTLEDYCQWFLGGRVRWGSMSVRRKVVGNIKDYGFECPRYSRNHKILAMAMKAVEQCRNAKDSVENERQEVTAAEGSPDKGTTNRLLSTAASYGLEVHMKTSTFQNHAERTKPRQTR